MRTVPPELSGQRLDQALARMFPEHSRSRLQAWLRDGHIRLDSRAAKPKQKIWGGEQVRLAPQPGPEDLVHVAERIDLQVVYEDPSVIVIDKPAGLVVHPGSGNWNGTMLNALLHHAPELARVPRAGIVHRLDKDTSGLLVVARTLEAQTDLVRQLQARTVKRDYLALVHGIVAGQGSVEGSIGRDARVRTRMAVTGRGKPALTHYRVRRRFGEVTLLECSLSTGRTHQIRVHMQSIGHPLVGDPVYRTARVRRANPALDAFGRQALHAWRLAFVHPASAKTMQFESPLPADMQDLLSALQ
ncbi:MAG: RNA pseudouridine synthase [Betaproteobacteria bacterium RBG_16_64_18]|nr:MAG: RNA pseudouridine synthase [Betaproteobacteria bacterium RBG_16_64_18]OGA38473.1 MAG: RNA pseudouridine synthase [Betaproteobacteria bacterium RIFCSPLOWO2_12_FULL_65_110]